MCVDKERERQRMRKAINLGAGNLDVVPPNVDLALLDLLFTVALNE